MKGDDSKLGLRQPAAAFPDDSLLSPAAAGCEAPKRQQAAALHGYEPFQGICLTDTFQLYEKGDLISNLLTNNSDRRKRQKALDIRVIMGNPPYSAGQKSANDDNPNVEYESLDERIHENSVICVSGVGGKERPFGIHLQHHY